jgi:hypothetical protein
MTTRRLRRRRPLDITPMHVSVARIRSRHAWARHHGNNARLNYYRLEGDDE